MTAKITLPDLMLLENGEFAIRDETLRWRFFEQSSWDRFGHEVASSPERIAMLSTARRGILLHQMPEPFKAGFVRGFYRASSTNGINYHDLEYRNSVEPNGNELDCLLVVMGYQAGKDASREPIESASSGKCNPVLLACS